MKIIRVIMNEGTSFIGDGLMALKGVGTIFFIPVLLAEDGEHVGTFFPSTSSNSNAADPEITIEKLLNRYKQ